MSRVAPLLSFLAALAVAGCVAPAAPGHSLAGSQWRFLSIDGEAPASDRAALSFEKQSLGANVGCNGMGGPWRIENGRLVAGPLAQTQMYCDGPVWQQEQAASALLVAAPEVTVQGDRMVLRSRGHFAELERVSPQLRKQ